MIVPSCHLTCPYMSIFSQVLSSHLVHIITISKQICLQIPMKHLIFKKLWFMTNKSIHNNVVGLLFKKNTLTCFWEFSDCSISLRQLESSHLHTAKYSFPFFRCLTLRIIWTSASKIVNMKIITHQWMYKH